MTEQDSLVTELCTGSAYAIVASLVLQFVESVKGDMCDVHLRISNLFDA
jgi:hypothetical protein